MERSRAVQPHIAELLEIVRGGGLTVLDEPVELASGEHSRYFIDGKQALSSGKDLRAACSAMIAVANEMNIGWDAVGGLTLGADHFAHGMAIVSGCDWFSVRKQPKGRGTNKLIEGVALGSSVRVLLVDDVVTTGKSIQQAYQAISNTGAQTVLAMTLVDRGEVAHAFFEQLGVPYRALLTYRDLEIPEVGTEIVSMSGRSPVM